MKIIRVSFILILAAVLAVCGCAAPEPAAKPEQPAAVEAAPEVVEVAPVEPVTVEPEPAGQPAVQSGEPNMTLLDDYFLKAVLKSYTFTADDSIELTFEISNENAERGTIWVIFNGINGWDVTSQQQGTAVMAVLPGEEREDTVRFSFADDPNAKYMGIRALNQLDLGIEGYVDSYNYEFKTSEFTLDFSEDAAKLGAAAEEIAFTPLVDSEWLKLSYCGEDADTGSIVLCQEVLKAVEGAEFKLYPIEQGLFDTEKYIALNSNSLGKVRKSLMSVDPILGSPAGEPSEFALVAAGIPMKPVFFTVPNRSAGEAGYASLPVIAENDVVKIRYDALNRRFAAENLTADPIQLVNQETFLLDGNEIRSNAQTVYVFPGTATAFRANGRGKDAKGVARNITITAENSTVSIGWDILLVSDGMSEPTPLSSIAVEDAKLR